MGFWWAAVLSWRMSKLTMERKRIVKTGRESASRTISYILRHHPERAGVVLDSHGWCDTASLIEGVRRLGHEFDAEMLEYIVENDNKGRFVFNGDHTRICATHGHSIRGLQPLAQESRPPAVLWHGTSRSFLSSIKEQGLQKRSRNFVHLSEDEGSAFAVGNRHAGLTIILKIDAAAMYADGYRFRRSTSGVWLVDNVPPRYIVNLMGFERSRHG